MSAACFVNCGNSHHAGSSNKWSATNFSRSYGLVGHVHTGSCRNVGPNLTLTLGGFCDQTVHFLRLQVVCNCVLKELVRVSNEGISDPQLPKSISEPKMKAKVHQSQSHRNPAKNFHLSIVRLRLRRVVWNRTDLVPPCGFTFQKATGRAAFPNWLNTMLWYMYVRTWSM